MGQFRIRRIFPLVCPVGLVVLADRREEPQGGRRIPLDNIARLVHVVEDPQLGIAQEFQSGGIHGFIQIDPEDLQENIVGQLRIRRIFLFVCPVSLVVLGRDGEEPQGGRRIPLDDIARLVHVVEDPQRGVPQDLQRRHIQVFVEIDLEHLQKNVVGQLGVIGIRSLVNLIRLNIFPGSGKKPESGGRVALDDIPGLIGIE